MPITFVPTKLYYKIREVCDIAGVEAYVLRFWETEFPALTPPKSKSGQRIYRPKDIELILSICKLLYEDGFTIAGARRQLGMRDPVKRPSEPHEPPEKFEKKKPPKKMPALQAGAPPESETGPLDRNRSKYAELPLFPDFELNQDEPEKPGQYEPWAEEPAAPEEAIEIEPEAQNEEENTVEPLSGTRTVVAEKASAEPLPTTSRLKRVQTELENILTLLGRE